MAVGGLRASQNAAAFGIVPFLLELVSVAIEDHVAALGIGGTEVPGALIADLAAAGVKPGIQQGIGRRLHLLVRSHVDRAIGIEVVVGAGGDTTGCKVSAGVGHGGIDGVGPEGTVISAEERETALVTGKTYVFSLGCKDKEDVVNAGRPVV